MRPDIRGLALVGSHARNQASACSDIDLIFLTENPGAFRDAAWLTTIDWSRAALHPDRWTDEEYGIVWSRRVWLDPGHVIEFSFAPLLWADVSPVDSGTFRVISDGCQILYDPERLLTRLKNSVSGGPA
ncbi:MAG: hypothetical protein JO051_09220 [Acidobacteriaceae bacterium]|nr:hypothetical protein [Acidobacteriaceae bacterium]